MPPKNGKDYTYSPFSGDDVNDEISDLKSKTDLFGHLIKENTQLTKSVADDLKKLLIERIPAMEKSFTKELLETRMSLSGEMSKELTEIKTQIATLRTKSTIFGAISGSIAGIVLTIVGEVILRTFF